MKIKNKTNWRSAQSSSKFALELPAVGLCAPSDNFLHTPKNSRKCPYLERYPLFSVWATLNVALLILNLLCPNLTVLAKSAAGEYKSTLPRGARQSIIIDPDKLANAIYKAEGGNKTRYPYGIKSVRCVGENDCRLICLNTIRNNQKRFTKQTKYTDFIEFLGSRYCPLNIKGEYHLNKNWVKNVKYFLTKKEE